MNKEKFWGALVATLDKEQYDPKIAGIIVAMVMNAITYAEEDENPPYQS